MITHPALANRTALTDEEFAGLFNSLPAEAKKEYAKEFNKNEDMTLTNKEIEEAQNLIGKKSVSPSEARQLVNLMKKGINTPDLPDVFLAQLFIEEGATMPENTNRAKGEEAIDVFCRLTRPNAGGIVIGTVAGAAAGYGIYKLRSKNGNKGLVLPIFCGLTAYSIVGGVSSYFLNTDACKGTGKSVIDTAEKVGNDMKNTMKNTVVAK